MSLSLVYLPRAFPCTRVVERMMLRDLVLVRAVFAFESIGFMEWHARVLRELSTTPLSVRDLAFRTGLFHYHVRGVLQDLLALQLIEYTRYGVQISSEWAMLLQLVECCEGDASKHSFDWEAAFEVSLPRVMSLKKRFDFDA